MTEKKLSLQQHRSIALFLQKDYTEMNKGDIAAKVGVSDRTLRRWQQNKDYKNELLRQNKRLMEYFLPTAYSELRRMIVSEDVSEKTKLKAISLYLRTQGLLKKDSHVIVTAENGLNSDLSFAELLEELN